MVRTSRPHLTPQEAASLKRYIRAKHKLGWSDREIIENWDGRQVCAKTLGLYRRAMGLPSNKSSERQRRQCAERARMQLKADGFKNLGEVWALSRRVKVARTGWPLDLFMRECEILSALEDNPQGLTCQEICSAIGLPWKGDSRFSLKCGGNRPGSGYLPYLLRRGFIVHERRRAGRDAERITYSDGRVVRKRPAGVYRLAEGVMRRHLKPAG